MSAGGPTVRGRFRPGTSGNPKGRPRKAATATASPFDILVDRTLTITRHGRPAVVTVEEALQHRTCQDAIAGRRMAQHEVLKWIRKREAWRAAQDAGRPHGTIASLVSEDPTNALDALLLLGIVAPDDRMAKGGPHDEDRRVLLEPWAVQAALDRRRTAAPLTEKERADILRCTRSGTCLRWPGADRA